MVAVKWPCIFYVASSKNFCYFWQVLCLLYYFRRFNLFNNFRASKVINWSLCKLSSHIVDEWTVICRGHNDRVLNPLFYSCKCSSLCLFPHEGPAFRLRHSTHLIHGSCWWQCQTVSAVIRAAQVILINVSIPNSKTSQLLRSDNLKAKLQTVLMMLGKEKNFVQCLPHLHDLIIQRQAVIKPKNFHHNFPFACSPQPLCGT